MGILLYFVLSSTRDSNNVMGRYCITSGEMHIVLSEVRCFEPSTAYPGVLFYFIQNVRPIPRGNDGLRVMWYKCLNAASHQEKKKNSSLVILTKWAVDGLQTPFYNHPCPPQTSRVRMQAQMSSHGSPLALNVGFSYGNVMELWTVKEFAFFL